MGPEAACNQFTLAAREKGLSKSDGDDIVMMLATMYQEALVEYASMKFLDLWYLKFDVEEIAQESKIEEVRQHLKKALARGEKQNHDVTLYKMTSSSLGKFSITADLYFNDRKRCG